PVAQVVLIERPGERKPDRTSAQRNGFGISLNIGDVVDFEVVVVRAGSYRVALDEIDAPRCIEVDDGVDVLLRSRLGEFNLVSVAKPVTTRCRRPHRILCWLSSTKQG